MLSKAVENIEKGFDVKFHDYDRLGDSILISSGFGIGLALMDEFTFIRFMIDIDEYRQQAIDWEAIAVLLSCARPRMFIMCGSFTADAPTNFENFKKGIINVPLKTYIGAQVIGETLASFTKNVLREYYQS